jgi:subfamily B ATP-binding cassette protein MsbA
MVGAVGERVIAQLRRELYAHIQSMPLSYFHSLHSAELMSRVVGDVNRLGRLSSSVLVMAVRHVGTIAVLLAVMFVREWVVALMAIAVFPAAGATVRLIGRKLYTINKRAQQRLGDLNVVLQESFAGTKIVKGLAEQLEGTLRRSTIDPAARPKNQRRSGAGILTGVSARWA